jgi:hypothetical protein
VEYYNHACADYSLKKLSKPDFKLDTNSPTISWADPRGTTEPGTKSQVVWCISIFFFFVIIIIKIGFRDYFFMPIIAVPCSFF